MQLCLVLPLSACAIAIWACGSDTDDRSSSGSGEGGSIRATSVAASAGNSGFDGGRPCMGCGEFMTSSHAGKTICKDESAMLLQALQECTCMACAGPCATACAGGAVAPECSTCKIMAESSTCADAYEACARDV